MDADPLAGWYLVDPLTSTHEQHWFFVGTYAQENAPGIFSFRFNPRTGTLIPGGTFSGIKNPSFLTVHPNGKWLYAVSETVQQSDGMPGSVHAFRIRDENQQMRLEFINQQSTGGDSPCYLQIDRQGRWLAAANYGSGSAAIFPILPDGQLAEMADFIQHAGQGPNKDRQAGPHAHSAVFSPDNRYLIVADLGIDMLVVYTFDQETGALKQKTVMQTGPGAGPRHLVFHPNGRYLLAVNELDNSVTVYRFNTETGNLSPQQTLSSLPEGAPKNIAAEIRFSASGRQLYVSNRGHDSIAVFRVGANAHLERHAVQPCGGKWPRHFTIAPGGRYLLVANQYSNALSVLPIAPGEMGLEVARSPTSVPRPTCVCFAAAPATTGQVK